MLVRARQSCSYFTLHVQTQLDQTDMRIWNMLTADAGLFGGFKRFSISLAANITCVADAALTVSPAMS